MPIAITYFVHGTTIDNEKNISSGWSDVGLSELGIQQSKDLRQTLQHAKYDAVFCSDLKRAKDSAFLVFDGVAPIFEDARLRECNYGTYNGKPSEIVEPLQAKHIVEPFPAGESYEDVKKRMADFLEFLKMQYPEKSVAIVSHQAPQLALDVLLRGKSWEQAFAQDWRLAKRWQPGWVYSLI